MTITDVLRILNKVRMHVPTPHPKRKEMRIVVLVSVLALIAVVRVDSGVVDHVWKTAVRHLNSTMTASACVRECLRTYRCSGSLATPHHVLNASSSRKDCYMLSESVLRASVAFPEQFLSYLPVGSCLSLKVQTNTTQQHKEPTRSNPFLQRPRHDHTVENQIYSLLATSSRFLVTDTHAVTRVSHISHGLAFTTGCPFTISLWIWLKQPLDPFRSSHGKQIIFASYPTYPSTGTPAELLPSILFNVGPTAEKRRQFFFSMSRGRESAEDFLGLWGGEVRFEQWTHLTLTVSGELMTFYQDGRLLDYLQMDYSIDPQTLEVEQDLKKDPRVQTRRRSKQVRQCLFNAATKLTVHTRCVVMKSNHTGSSGDIRYEWSSELSMNHKETANSLLWLGGRSSSTSSKVSALMHNLVLMPHYGVSTAIDVQALGRLTKPADEVVDALGMLSASLRHSAESAKEECREWSVEDPRGIRMASNRSVTDYERVASGMCPHALCDAQCTPWDQLEADDGLPDIGYIDGPAFAQTQTSVKSAQKSLLWSWLFDTISNWGTSASTDDAVAKADHTLSNDQTLAKPYLQRKLKTAIDEIYRSIKPQQIRYQRGRQSVGYYLDSPEGEVQLLYRLAIRLLSPITLSVAQTSVSNSSSESALLRIANQWLTSQDNRNTSINFYQGMCQQYVRAKSALWLAFLIGSDANVDFHLLTSVKEEEVFDAQLQRLLDNNEEFDDVDDTVIQSMIDSIVTDHEQPWAFPYAKHLLQPVLLALGHHSSCRTELSTGNTPLEVTKQFIKQGFTPLRATNIFTELLLSVEESQREDDTREMGLDFAIFPSFSQKSQSVETIDDEKSDDNECTSTSTAAAIDTEGMPQHVRSRLADRTNLFVALSNVSWEDWHSNASLFLQDRIANKTAADMSSHQARIEENEEIEICLRAQYLFPVSQYVVAHDSITAAGVSVLDDERIFNVVSSMEQDDVLFSSSSASLSLSTLSTALGELDGDHIFTAVNAENGNAEAMVWLGKKYFWGLGGLPRDEIQALRWFERAAAMNHAEALYNVGCFHANGQGNYPVNATKAREYFRRAALREEDDGDGFPMAMHALAKDALQDSFDSRGQLIARKNVTFASELLIRAAALGDLSSTFLLSLLILESDEDLWTNSQSNGSVADSKQANSPVEWLLTHRDAKRVPNTDRNMSRPQVNRWIWSEEQDERIHLSLWLMAAAASHGHVRASNHLAHALIDTSSWLNQYLREREDAMRTRDDVIDRWQQELYRLRALSRANGLNGLLAVNANSTRSSQSLWSRVQSHWQSWTSKRTRPTLSLLRHYELYAPIRLSLSTGEFTIALPSMHYSADGLAVNIDSDETRIRNCRPAFALLQSLAEMSYRPRDVSSRGMTAFAASFASAQPSVNSSFASTVRAIAHFEEAAALGLPSMEENAVALVPRLSRLSLPSRNASKEVSSLRIAKLIHWLRLARGGEPLAMRMLAEDMLSEQERTLIGNDSSALRRVWSDSDYQQASQWLALAAAIGSSQASFSLAVHRMRSLPKADTVYDIKVSALLWQSMRMELFEDSQGFLRHQHDNDRKQLNNDRVNSEDSESAEHRLVLPSLHSDAATHTAGLAPAMLLAVLTACSALRDLTAYWLGQQWTQQWVDPLVQRVLRRF